MFSCRKTHQRQTGYEIARYSHCAVFYENNLYIHGGQLDGPNMDYCDKLYQFNTEKSLWVCMPVEIRPEFRRNHSTVLWKHFIYLYGGCGSWEIIKLNDLWIYDLNTLKWSMVRNHEFLDRDPSGNPIIEARTRHTANVYGDSMIVFGGNVTEGKEETNTNETFEYGFVSGEWKKLVTTGVFPLPRHSHATVIGNHKLYMFGGRDVHGNRFCDLHSLDLRTRDWKEYSSQGDIPLPRAGVNLMISGNTIMFFGGFDGNVFMSDAYAYDLKKLKWDSLPPCNDEKTLYCKAYYTTCRDGRRWIHFGGAGQTGQKMDDLFITEFTEPIFHEFDGSAYCDVEFVW
jgi:N-acetylneuraminic acid mutarotase